MAMTPEAKKALSSTIRGLRQRLLEDLHVATESAYRLSVRSQDAGLDEAARTKRKRLDDWLDEQLRAQASGARSREREDFRREAEQQAAYTLLNRLVILRLMEEPGPSGQPLRKPALIKGGWGSTAYQDFRDLARGVVRDDPTEGFGFLLHLVCEELSEDLPGLFGSAGIGDLIPIPPATLRYAVEELNKEELESCWSDDMTLGWVYQYWNDPERERLDAKINDGGKIEPHEIASKTQMFTERYMVDWMLQNSLGLMWFTLCKKHGWIPEVQANGTLQRLEKRRFDWRAERAAGEVRLTELMPLESEEERRWAYFLPGQEIPEEAVELAPESVREWKILDPAVGSGHFLVVALGLLLALFQEEARHRGLQNTHEWSDRGIVEHLLAHTLHGIDIDPRAVQIAAASLWLKGKGLCPEIEPEQLNLVAPNLRLADLPYDDPALVELRSDIEAETGIAGEFTSQILQALQGADHLGSLLKIDRAVETAIQHQEDKVAWLKQPQQKELLEQAGAKLDEKTLQFSSADARTTMQDVLDQFLTHHSSANDLGLRLHGEQLAAGVRFVRLLKEGSYHLVIANPPYQGTGKMASTSYVELNYPLGKPDLYAAFLLRGLELAKQGGMSTMLTMRNWMFLKQYAGLREHLIGHYSLAAIGDFDRGAFEGIPDEVVSVGASIISRRKPSSDQLSQAHCPTPREDTSRDSERTARKRSATRAQEGVCKFHASDLKAVPDWPLVYWWDENMIHAYASSPLMGTVAPCRAAQSTGDNLWFVRLAWELPASQKLSSSARAHKWQPLIKGAAGLEWIEPINHFISWGPHGLPVKISKCHKTGVDTCGLANEEFYLNSIGIAFSAIGSNFSARKHRVPSIFESMGSSVFPDDVDNALCVLNSKRSRDILASLNPTVHFQVGDVNRLPLVQIDGAKEICSCIEESFGCHEFRREPSVEFAFPGPSPWRYAQEWAQKAVDRPEGALLPEYIEELDPEPPTDHLSFALGVALGRFAPVDEQGQPTTSNPAGILDPSTADLSHALPAGLLFLDGSLEANDLRDGLGAEASASLHQAWSRYGTAIAPSRSLREWLRLDFFKDVHKGMYENRPIHWPLSSSSKTFVAWVNIHRMDSRTLKVLLADHLIPARSRIDGELDDLRQVRDAEDRKAAREADNRIGKLTRWREELQAFIAAVE